MATEMTPQERAAVHDLDHRTAQSPTKEGVPS